MRNPRIEMDIDDAADINVLEGAEIRGARMRQWLATHARPIGKNPNGTAKISA
jgi:hypothetical protein